MHVAFFAFALIGLIVATIVAAIFGIRVLDESKSAIHEIEAFLLFLTSAVFASAAAMVLLLDFISHRVVAAIEASQEESQKAALIRSERQLAVIVETINNLRVKR
ncbi:MAG: hypothetical protein WD069_08975 [Planctomycetales bacterium]